MTRARRHRAIQLARTAWRRRVVREWEVAIIGNGTMFVGPKTLKQLAKVAETRGAPRGAVPIASLTGMPIIESPFCCHREETYPLRKHVQKNRMRGLHV